MRDRCHRPQHSATSLLARTRSALAIVLVDSKTTLTRWRCMVRASMLRTRKCDPAFGGRRIP